MGALTYGTRDSGAFDLILARHAGDVGTGTTNPASFDNGSSSSRLRHVPCDKLSTCPAAEDENFKLF